MHKFLTLVESLEFRNKPKEIRELNFLNTGYETHYTMLYM